MGYLAARGLAHLVDKGTGMSAPVLQTATIWYLAANEGLSITENLGEIGVPSPFLAARKRPCESCKNDEQPRGWWIVIDYCSGRIQLVHQTWLLVLPLLWTGGCG